MSETDLDLLYQVRAARRFARACERSRDDLHLESERAAADARKAWVEVYHLESLLFNEEAK